jgi:hypothetical protein
MFIIVTRFLMLLAATTLISLVGLLSYHLWLLMWAGTTTKMHLKGVRTGRLSIIDRLRGSDALFNLRSRIIASGHNPYSDP